MKVFLSYRYGDDVTGLINYLKQNDIEVYDSLTEMNVGSSLQNTIRDAVKNADFMVVVYSNTNPNIAFETGMAIALGKPVFSILQGNIDDSFLMDSPYVRASPNDIEKIKYLFDIFLTKLTTPTKLAELKDVRHIYYGGGEIVPSKNYFDVVNEYKRISGEGDIELENLFERIFEMYGVKIVKKKSAIEKIITSDFTIWYDHLSNTLGNPIMVEITSHLDAFSYSDFLLRINAIRNSNKGISMLVFYDGLAEASKQFLPSEPSCLFIEIEEFVNRIANNGFASVIKEYRNKLIHKL